MSAGFATFRYTAYSLAGDGVMFWQLLTGAIPFDEGRAARVERNP